MFSVFSKKYKTRLCHDLCQRQFLFIQLFITLPYSKNKNIRAIFVTIIAITTFKVSIFLLLYSKIPFTINCKRANIQLNITIAISPPETPTFKQNIKQNIKTLNITFPKIHFVCIVNIFIINPSSKEGVELSLTCIQTKQTFAIHPFSSR